MVRFAFLFWVLMAGMAGANCRQALVLALDVSGSVDENEYRLQMDGLAAALTSDAVSEAVLAYPDAPIAIAVYEWSGIGYKRLISDWTMVHDRSDLAAVSNTLKSERRNRSTTSTAIGAAMDYAAWLFYKGPDCWNKTLDVSGDGKNNDGDAPEIIRAKDIFSDVTINALVIGPGDPMDDEIQQMAIMELSAYFQRYVIHGPNAFVEVALGFEDYENAMTRKLLRELQGLAISQLSIK